MWFRKKEEQKPIEVLDQQNDRARQALYTAGYTKEQVADMPLSYLEKLETLSDTDLKKWTHFVFTELESRIDLNSVKITTGPNAAITASNDKYSHIVVGMKLSPDTKN